MNSVRSEDSTTIQSMPEKNSAPKNIPIWKRIFRGVRTIIFSIAALVFLMKALSWIGIDVFTPIDRALSQFSAQQKYVDIVREGTFAARPNQKIGEAFDKFFGSPKWSAFDSDTGQKIVEFTGDMTYQGQPVKARMQFVVNPETNSFEIHTIGFNEIPQNKFMQAALLAKVFEGKEIETSKQTTADSGVTPVQQSEGTDVQAATNKADTPDQQTTAPTPPENASETVVEGLAVAFPEGKVVLYVNDQEQEYPVASDVSVNEGGAPSNWSNLRANQLLQVTIQHGVVVKIDIL
ncbi:hypothetical protein PMI08_01081 [Brevibacillus sp. CF112]|uniref:hypothetical protein n=1 Tax=Brevibacillus TaxID=55080 RepID=UPI0002716564|nr:hypothetical protein [Brevibacillus sp. CF112]EJL46586.1 hypothetical protein PMI08_01081 [Brevibacillus sp. CF112]